MVLKEIMTIGRIVNSLAGQPDTTSLPQEAIGNKIEAVQQQETKEQKKDTISFQDATKYSNQKKSRINAKVNHAGIEASTSYNPTQGIKVGTRANLIGTINIGDAIVNYTGRHNLGDITNENSYLGRNSISAGGKNWKVKPSVVAMTKSNGIADIKYGGKSTYAVKLTGAKAGFFEVVANDKAVNATVLAKYGLGNKCFLDLTNITNIPYNGDANNYTEIQLSKKFGKYVSLFVRDEIKAGKGKFNQTYRGGVYISTK